MGSRRGRTGYLIFANERRLEVLNQLKEKQSGSQKFAIAEVSKELGRLWNELSEEQREEYKSQAASSKVPLLSPPLPSLFQPEQSELKSTEEPHKNTQLSQSTVKKIMTEDDEVKRISAEGLKAMTIATELFLKSLTERCNEHSKAHRRSNIRVGDLESALSGDDRLDASSILDKLHSLGPSKGAKRAQEEEEVDDDDGCSKRQKLDDNSESSR